MEQEMNVYELIDAYKELLDRKDELKELTTENNKKVMAARDQLAKAMIEAESPRISRGGFMYSLGEKVEYSKRGCNEDEFFDFLRDQGLGDIIKPTVNARTLNSTMKEVVGMYRDAAEAQADDPADIPSDWLPEAFSDYISAYAFYDVTKRKEANRTAQKAQKARA